MKTHASVSHSHDDEFRYFDKTGPGTHYGVPHAVLQTQDAVTRDSHHESYYGPSPARIAAVVQRKAEALLALAAMVRERHGIEANPAPEPPRDCPTCAEPGMKPSHNGSPSCESGSIASGGPNAHCSCGVCF